VAEQNQLEIETKPAGEIESPRFLWVAALTAVISVAAVIAVRAWAIRILHPSSAFAPLASGPPIVDTLLGVVAAIFVFLRVASNPNGLRLWRYVSTAALVLSFAPDVWLATSHQMGGGWPEAFALMLMHVVVWAVCITLLPRLAFSEGSSSRPCSNRSTSIL
jgi:hypothetical protein